MALAAFGVLVVAGAVMAVRDTGGPTATSVASVTDAATSTPSSAATGTPTAAASGSTVVVAGVDLATMTGSLSRATGFHVVSVATAEQDVLAPAALNAVTGAPSAVVLEVLAGSKTTMRTTAAISAVTARWPQARVIVIGPFSSSDRKSSAAVKTAAQAAKVTFLDPVDLRWRAGAASAGLTAADRTSVVTQLAAALG
ncbi:MAG: hypothetical protein JWO12_3469 [Frankiales bacterium]|nr:hypothetical protein [Frankiales bacterium]